MSNFGQAALAVAGAVVGGFIGGPQGAMMGFNLGLTGGGLLFPEDLPGTQGPRLTDSAVTTSVIGAPIPFAFGKTSVAGVVIHSGPLVEHANTEEVGGKGGPKQEVTNYTYTRSYAVLLCRGPISGILRIWRNDKLVYDIRPQLPDESDDAYGERVAATQGFAEGMTVYLGDESQMPDPTLEGLAGVGNVPAYRGRAYVVFENEDQTDTGGRPANWRFEVVALGEAIAPQRIQLAAAALYPWRLSYADPRACKNDHEYSYDPPGSDPPGPWGSFEAAVLAAEAFLERSLSLNVMGWSRSSSPRTAPFDTLTGDPEIAEVRLTNTVVYERIVRFIGNDEFLASGGTVGGNPDFQDLFDLNCEVGKYYWIGTTAGTSLGAVFYISATAGLPPPDGSHGWLALNNCIPGFGCPYPGGTLWALPDARIQVRRVLRTPDTPCAPRCEDPYPLLPENVDYCVIDGQLEHTVGYSVAAGSFKALANYRVDTGEVTDYPLGAVIAAGSADDTQAFWEEQYSEALARGEKIRSGLVYGVNYPVVPTTAYRRGYEQPALEVEDPTIGSIVRQLCQAAGLDLDRLDTSALTETVPGYRVASIMSARAAIQPLQSYSYFDCVESDGLLKFRPRGAGVVASLGSDDLAAHFAGETVPPLVSMEWQQDVDLPQLLRLRYEMGEKDYQPGMQQAQRLTTEAVNKEDIELAINMTDDKAAQIVNVLLQERWWARESYKLKISPRWLGLEVGDPVEIPVDGQTERVRLTRWSMPPPFGVIEAEALRDDDGSYVSRAIGGVAVPATGGVSLIGPTELVIIDSAALDANGNDAGVYVAASGIFSGWNGANVLVSADGGDNYKTVASILTSATMGRTVGAAPAGPLVNLWDLSTVLTVDLNSGSLESRTEEAVLNGANAAFLGADGRWEVIQYTTATFLGTFDGRARYQLTGLLRGRRGTEWAQSLHEDGDRFVFVGPGLIRVTRENGDIGKALQFKAVSLGTQAQATAAYDQVLRGTALKPYAPCQIRAERKSNADIQITWKRRTRLGGPWLDGADIPLNEASEAYSVRILDQNGLVAHTASTLSPEFLWLASSQAAELGEYPRYLRVRVSQKSAVVGAGYEAEALIDLRDYIPAEDGSSPPPPTRTVRFDFEDTFSTADGYVVNFTHILPGSQVSLSFTIDGAGKASLEDFASDLATAIASSYPNLVVTRPTTESVQVTTSTGYLFADQSNNVFNARVAPLEIVSLAQPVTGGVLSQAFIDLYDNSVLSPDAGGEYTATGGASASFKIGGLTWEKRKELDAAAGNTGAMSRDFTVNWFVPPGSTPQGAISGLAAQINITPELAPYIASASLGQDVGGLNEMKRTAVVIAAKSNYSIKRITSLSVQGIHPTGYEPRLLPLVAGTADLPAGQKQLAKLSYSVSAGLGVPPDGYLLAGQIFWVELDGIRYEFEADVGDEGQLYFDAAYDALKADIEASGDFDVTLVKGTNNEVTPDLFTYYMEIERNVVNTPFTYDAYASYGGRLIVTNS